MIAADAMSYYQDLNKPFNICDYELGTVITQDSRPIPFWSKKLTSSQKNYNTTEMSC